MDEETNDLEKLLPLLTDEILKLDTMSESYMYTTRGDLIFFRFGGLDFFLAPCSFSEVENI